MKKLIFGAWFALMGLGAVAQHDAPVKTVGMPQVSTNNDIRQLSNQLQLNEGQYIRLRDLHKARQEQIAEINSMYSNDPAMRQAKINAAQQDFESRLAQSISQKQFTAYLELQGRQPGAAGAAYQAGGYGGRSMEEGVTQTETQAPAGVPLESNIDQGKVDADKKPVKIHTEEGELKVKAKKEKIETDDMEYKADRDEAKIKSKDGTIKVKSEKGKTKLETPDGKMKIKDGEVKVKPKRGSRP